MITNREDEKISPVLVSETDLTAVPPQHPLHGPGQPGSAHQPGPGEVDHHHPGVDPHAGGTVARNVTNHPVQVLHRGHPHHLRRSEVSVTVGSFDIS